MGNSSIRILNADIESVSSAIEQFLSKQNFIKNESLSRRNLIVAENPETSFMKLLINGHPQIIVFGLENISDDKTRLEMKVAPFKRFRILYCILTSSILLLSGLCSYFCRLNNNRTNFKDPLSVMKILDSDRICFNENTLFVLSIILFFTSVFIVLGHLYADKEKYLFEEFNEYMESALITTESNLQDQTLSPGIFDGPIIITFGSLVVYNIDKLNANIINVFNFSTLIMFLLLGILCLLALSLFFFYHYPHSVIKVCFIAPGLLLAADVFFFSNIPSINYEIGSELKNHKSKFDIVLPHENKPIQDNERHDRMQNRIETSNNIFLWAYFSMFVFLGTILLSLNIVMLALPVKLTKEINKYPLSSSESIYFKALDYGHWLKYFNMIIFTFWIILVLGNVIGIYVTASIICWLLGINSIYFDSAIAGKFIENIKVVMAGLFNLESGQILKIFLMLYISPIVILIAVAIFKWLRRAFNGFNLLIRTENNNLKVPIEQLVRPVCYYANIGMPIVRIIKFHKNVHAGTSFIGFPVFQNVLLVSDNIFRQFDEEEIVTLLAHEIGHMKKHTLLYRVQCAVSDLSFAGSGFLNILSSSFKIEYEADKFAVEYLKSKGNDASCLISLLEGIRDREKTESIKEAFSISSSGSLNFAFARYDDYRENMIIIYDSSSFLKRLLISYNLFYQMCFGDEVLSYFHPPIEERIKRIKSYG